MAKNTQLDSCFYPPVTPTVKPTNPGPQSSGLNGDNLPKRTSSPAAEKEKLFEPVSGGPDQTK